MNGLSEKTRARLGRVSVSTLATCLLQKGLRNCVMQGVLPVSDGAARMVGEAFTLRFIPAREDIDRMSNYAREDFLHRRAVEECPPGHVLVIDSCGRSDAGSAGDIMMARMKARGVGGAVTDGGFRDTPDIRKLGFPAYHAAPAPRSTPVAFHPADMQQPIGCGGVAVYPGDVIVGDSEGVIVIPAHLAEEVAEKAEAMTEYEAFAAQKVSEGRSIFGLYPAGPEALSEFEEWRAAHDAVDVGA